MNVVLQVDATTFNQIQTTYPNNATCPPGASFHAKLKGVTVIGYTKSRKVMFQGQLAQQEASRWGEVSQPTPPKAKTNGHLPADFATWSVLGSDEVNAGSYFGPLTTAAVYVSHEQVAALQKLGVQDSKKLTDPQIIKLAEQIIQLCPYTVLNLMPAQYNERMQRYNQAQLKALCHNLVLTKTLAKLATPPQAILIDQFVQRTTYYRYVGNQAEVARKNVYFQTKAETAHVAVAAASIVARYYSLQAMDELSQQAGLTLPIGAGHAVDVVAARLLERGQDLNKFAKVHFGNTKKAHAIYQQH